VISNGESDGDLFETDFLEANDKYAQKLNSTFNDKGVKIEPFSITKEVRDGILTKDGVYKMKRERDDSFDLANDDDQYEEDEDPWFKSIK
jgi:hypothetical protein